MLLTLIRHSQSLVNPHIPIVSWGLSDQGIILAKQLNGSSFLTGIDVLYSSLQTKALETAVIVTKNTGMYIKTDNRLTEITSFTNGFESNPEQYKKNMKEFYSGQVKRLWNGETAEEAVERFNKAIAEIVITEKYKKNVGIVSHGNILAYFSTQFVDKPPFTIIASIKQPDVAILDWTTKKFVSFFGDIKNE